MRHIYIKVFLFFINLLICTSQVGTYTFATANIQGQSVVESLSGVTLTVTFDGGGDPDLVGYDGYGGVTGNSVYNNTESSKLILSFDETVTIFSLRLADGIGEMSLDVVITGYPGAMSVNTTVPADDGIVANLGSAGENVTSIEITAQPIFATYFILDDVVLQSILPVELISFEALLIDNEVILNWETATEVNNFTKELRILGFRITEF